MSIYFEAINRLAEEYKADVRALEAAQQRIADYEAALPTLREVYDGAFLVVSTSNGKVSVFFSGLGQNVPGERVDRAFLANKPLYNWNGFDVV